MDIETVAEEVVVEAARSFNPVVVLVGGILIGAAAGFYFGSRYNREKIRAEEFKKSQEEVEVIREVYLQKTVAAEPKPSVETLMKDKGYSNAEIARQTGQSETKIREHLLKAPVPIQHPLVRDGDWDYAIEIQHRTEDDPYVVHQDEYQEGKVGYSSVTYVYWALDDVLCGEDEHPLPHADLIVGQSNLKFGHGSDDPEIVYVRNDRLELDMEICRVHKSYEQEVLGHDPDEGS